MVDKPWGVYVVKGSPQLVHIIPENDIIKHSLHEMCLCGDVQIDSEDAHGIVYVHRAVDEREN